MNRYTRSTPGSRSTGGLFLLGVTLAAAVLLGGSCSGHAPELASLEYRLALRPLDPRGTLVSEQLSVFAAVRDEDGIKDLAALHILHDGEELLWTLTSETWTRNDRNKETWVGGTEIGRAHV